MKAFEDIFAYWKDEESKSQIYIWLIIFCYGEFCFFGVADWWWPWVGRWHDCDRMKKRFWTNWRQLWWSRIDENTLMTKDEVMTWITWSMKKQEKSWRHGNGRQRTRTCRLDDMKNMEIIMWLGYWNMGLGKMTYYVVICDHGLLEMVQEHGWLMELWHIWC